MARNRGGNRGDNGAARAQGPSRGGGMVQNKFNNKKGGGKGRNAPQAERTAPWMREGAKRFPIPSQGGGRRGQTPQQPERGRPQPKGKAGGRRGQTPQQPERGRQQPQKGKGKAQGKGKGKGKVQGQAQGTTKEDKIKEKMRAIDASLKLWVGGLSDKITWKSLDKHFEQYAKPSIVDLMKRGTACISYKTEEEVLGAIATLNGTELDGKTIEVDAWTKPDKSERRERKGKKEDGEGEDGVSEDGEDKPKRKRGGKKNKKEAPGKQVIQGGKFAKKQMQQQKKGKGKGKGGQDDKYRKKLQDIDHSCKVWLGGLPNEVSIKEAIGFFESVGKPKVIDIRRKGTACVAFASESDALSAISTLNGSELKGKTIQVDEWTKPDRSERRGKKGKDDDDA